MEMILAFLTLTLYMMLGTVAAAVLGVLLKRELVSALGRLACWILRVGFGWLASEAEEDRADLAKHGARCGLYPRG